LPKPVVSKDIERFGNEHFTCAVASMNGFRERMEDSHSVDFHPTYGFFAVFDGHMDPHCSAYLGEHFPKAIEKAKPPLTDEALQELSVDLDCEYLALNKESGSTGTYFIANIEKGSAGPTFNVQVGNVGDSRVICCRDGTAIPMTTDHKPTLDEEKARIVACGGEVVNGRVDGNLAVSRAYGDKQYKGSAAGPTQQKVIALPEVTHIKCTANDVMVLSCDGVFEGNFDNDAVVEFVTKQLETCEDLGDVAARVCDAALERGSKDNITCMLVQFKDGTNRCTPHTEFRPGPFNAPTHQGFRTAYSAMGEKVNLTLAQQLQMRYAYLQKTLTQLHRDLGWPEDDKVEDFSTLSEETLRSILKANKEAFEGVDKPTALRRITELTASGRPLIPADIKEVRDELQTYGEGPSEGEDEAAYFEAQVTRMCESSAVAANAGEGDGVGADGATKIVVDANIFARLQQLQQHTGGQIPLPLLLGLLQASGNAGAGEGEE